MCTVMEGNCGCHGGSGPTAGDVAVIIAGLATAGLGYRLIATAPLAFFTLWLLMLAAMWKPTRQYAWRAVRFVARYAWRRWRQRTAKPSTDVVTSAPARTWHVDLFALAGGATTVLGTATVAGVWPTASAVEAEAIQAYVAAKGLPAGATVTCQARELSLAA